MTPLAMALTGLGAAAGLGLVLLGLRLERGRPAANRDTVIRPLAASPPQTGPSWQQRWRAAVARHPARWQAVLETGVWIAIATTAGLHLCGERDGPVAFAIWALTIGPHEIGHVICLPFGHLLHLAGGSIWQILVFVLPAAYYFFVRHQVTGPLVFVALAGHSLINLAAYIGDARAREMPLILGLDNDHHDWWNLLRELDMLEYDYVLARLTEVSGAGLILLACAMGIITAWLLPRSKPGIGSRFRGSFWRALRGDPRQDAPTTH